MEEGELYPEKHSISSAIKVQLNLVCMLTKSASMRQSQYINWPHQCYKKNSKNCMLLLLLHYLLPNDVSLMAG